MGFTGVRESFSLVDWVHAKLKVGGGEVEWIGYGGTALVGNLEPVSVCGVELRLSLDCAWGEVEGKWDPYALSLSLSLRESWKSFEGKMRV